MTEILNEANYIIASVKGSMNLVILIKLLITFEMYLQATFFAMLDLFRSSSPRARAPASPSDGDDAANQNRIRTP